MEKQQFERLTISQMAKAKREAEEAKLLENITRDLDKQITERAEELAQHLIDGGYEPDSFEIHTQNTFTENTIKVTYLVVRKIDELTFTIGGEQSGETN